MRRPHPVWSPDISDDPRARRAELARAARSVSADRFSRRRPALRRRSRGSSSSWRPPSRPPRTSSRPSDQRVSAAHRLPHSRPSPSTRPRRDRSSPPWLPPRPDRRSPAPTDPGVRPSEVGRLLLVWTHRCWALSAETLCRPTWRRRCSLRLSLKPNSSQLPEGGSGNFVRGVSSLLTAQADAPSRRRVNL